MNRIEFIARCLARIDGVFDPDTLVVDKEYHPWENRLVREIPPPDRCKPAWHFYLQQASNALSAAVNFDAMTDTTDDILLKNISSGNTSLMWDHERNGFGVNLDHPAVERLRTEIRELFK